MVPADDTVTFCARKAQRRLAGHHVEHLGPIGPDVGPVHAVGSRRRRRAAAVVPAQRHRVVLPDEHRVSAEVLRRQPARAAARVVPEDEHGGVRVVVPPDLVELAVAADGQVLGVGEGADRVVRRRERGRRVERRGGLVEQWHQRRRRPSLAAGGEAEDVHVAAGREAVHHLLAAAVVVVHHVGDAAPVAVSAEAGALEVGPSAVPVRRVDDAAAAGDRRRGELARRRVRREDDLEHHHIIPPAAGERVERDLAAGVRVHEDGAAGHVGGDPAVAGADAAARRGEPRGERLVERGGDHPRGHAPGGEALPGVAVAEDEERRRGRPEGVAPGGADAAESGVGLDGEATGDVHEEVRRQVLPPTRHGGQARSTRPPLALSSKYSDKINYYEIEIGIIQKKKIWVIKLVKDIHRIISKLP